MAQPNEFLFPELLKTPRKWQMAKIITDYGPPIMADEGTPIERKGDLLLVTYENQKVGTDPASPITANAVSHIKISRIVQVDLVTVNSIISSPKGIIKP